jgi:rhodanese-related sulfurtransferase
LFAKNIVFLQKFKLFDMNLTQEDWIAQFESDDNAVILDVRTAMEFDEGFIAGAINHDFHQGAGFVADLETLDKSKNYYVYCRSGARSANACAIMNEMGFENTYNLLGGIIEWDGDIV